jgi:glycosyltransferase involved in cell wall biosynthesis
MNLSASVVIPAYNAAAFLEETLAGVLAQSQRPLEVLVVDDGSTDGTGAIAERFGSPVRCIRQENRGLSEARNRGIREARGGLIALLDADDLWLPAKLERQAALLEAEPRALAAFTLTDYIDAEGRVLRRSAAPRYPDLVRALLLHSCVVGPPSAALIRREALDRVGLFDPRFSQCADWDMWLRLAEAGPIVYVEEPLVRYRVHASNMSRSIPLLERDTLAVLERFFVDHPEADYARLKNQCYSNHWLILSGSYLAAGAPRDSLRCLVRGVMLHPANVSRPLGLPGRWLRRRIVRRDRLQSL